MLRTCLMTHVVNFFHSKYLLTFLQVKYMSKHSFNFRIAISALLQILPFFKYHSIHVQTMLHELFKNVDGYALDPSKVVHFRRTQVSNTGAKSFLESSSNIALTASNSSQLCL